MVLHLRFSGEDHMNKYLVMTAAALAAASSAATTTAAVASSGTATVWVLTTAGYSRFCDNIHTGWNGAQSAQSDDLYTYCGYNFQSRGTGAIGKVKKVGNTMINGDDQEAYFVGSPGFESIAFEYTPSPSVTTTSSGTVALYYSSTCCSSHFLLSDPYVIVGPAAGHHPVKSKVSLVKSLIASGKLKMPTKGVKPYGDITPF
jgi:hypothetical protein